MNIIEYLEKTVPTLVSAASADELNNEAAREALSIMEMHIRRGIAAELEDLVRPGAGPLPHGLPIHTATSLDCTRYIPPSLFYKIQQEFFRAAANVITGKDKATPDDWHEQAERMRRNSVNASIESLTAAFDMPPASEEDRKAQLAFEAAEERKRERSE